MTDEKRISRQDIPFINWRYILFKWNDSDEEMDLARRMAADIGVNRLYWEVTDYPEDSFSRRFVRGTPELEGIRKETWDDNNLGNAIHGATPKARIDVKAILPGLCDRDGTLIDRDFARARLPGSIEGGAAADIQIEIPAVAKPGRYSLKFDLVSEGLDWFEHCGPPTTARPLWVR